MKKTRRQYTKEFKLDAVRLVTEQGYKRCEAARNLGVDHGTLGRWVREFEETTEQVVFRGNGKLTEEQAELRRLREENRRLKMERDILKNPPRAVAPHL